MTDKIKETEVLRKHIIGENGISYTLGEDGLYYPDLRLPEGTHYEIGRYGRMRAEYLKENHREGQSLAGSSPGESSVKCIRELIR